MLVQLNITDFAIIKHLELTLGPGLNAISGETGAGKSIIINAMNLILGGRASGDLIRTGCREATVEALFAVPENQSLKERLSQFSLPFDGELLIKRSIFREGRNKILINGSLATLQMLSRLGPSLVSISGQYEHQLLLRPENHLYLLDDLGGLTPQRLQLGEHYSRHQSLAEKIKHLEQEIREIEERQDLTRFQIQEIEGAAISLGEDEALSREKKIVQHAEELLEIVSEGYQSLYERNDSVLSGISQCAKRLERGAAIDPALSPIREDLSEIEVKLEDISFALRDLQKGIRMDPRRLEEIGERLELLNRLKRKYGPTLGDVLRFRDNLASAMYDLDEKRDTSDQLVRERQDLEKALIHAAKALSKQRKKWGGILENEMEKELHQLHMEQTRFQVGFEGPPGDGEEPREETIQDLRPDGFDRPEFMISPNVGEELRPLSRIASGGELSRIMLALKSILAKSASVETLIFDEVDAGISGATAEVIGEKLLSLAQYHQILCITHLPQIASQGQRHFLVRKEVIAARTQTAISELDPDSRVQEIARLLGGREITPRAIAHAREMLQVKING
ncbi:MAG: DNA repair protein RecN [Desulfobacteraceae bacterium]|nr:DNA repair protein RecN [Desulfobacteraceae bacterium]